MKTKTEIEKEAVEKARSIVVGFTDFEPVHRFSFSYMRRRFYVSAYYNEEFIKVCVVVHDGRVLVSFPLNNF